jgi:hypothetical protein
MMKLKEKQLEDFFRLELAKIDKEGAGASDEAILKRKKKLMEKFKQVAALFFFFVINKEAKRAGLFVPGKFSHQAKTEPTLVENLFGTPVR